MAAKTAAERTAAQRERDRRISIDLFHADDAKLIRTMARLGIDEPQDVISRLIHGADRLDDESLAELTIY